MDWHISSSQWKSMMSDGSLVWQIFRLLVLSPSTFWDRKRIKMKRSSLQLSKMKQVKHGCGGWITPTILTNIRVGRHFQGCGGHFQGCRAAVTGTWLFSQLLLVELWNDEKHCKHCRQQWQLSFLGFLYLHQLGAQQHNLSNLQHCC